MPRDLANPASNSIQLPELNVLLGPVRRAAQVQFNGNLYLRWGESAPWGLSFRHGRLVWAWASNHRLRRWRQLLSPQQQHVLAQSPQLGFASAQPVWEYETLRAMVAQEQIDREAALQLIHQNLMEVLFDLVQLCYSSGQSPQLESQPFKLEHPLKFFASSEVFMEVHQAWAAWCAAELQNYSPMLAPCIHQPAQLRALMSEASYRNLQQLLQGQRSLRELARLMNQDLLQLCQTLVSYERRRLIKFIELPQPLGELPAPAKPVPAQHQSSHGPLVLCIDDSPLVCRQLGSIIQAAGCRYAAVQNSLEGLQRVLELKPDLIFLDLVMPIVSGYELCAQIRRVADLRDIPIVILTSNDGVIDRVRLKVAGSTDFLGKPIATEAIQTVLATHCLAVAA